MFSLSTFADFGLGLLLGYTGGVFGIGGGLIAIPVLVWLFGMDQQLAQGTALVMIAPNVLLGFWRYRKHNPIEIKSALVLGLSSIASTYVAAKFASGLDSHTMQLVFACFLVSLSAFLLFELRPRKLVATTGMELSHKGLGALGLLSGVFSGLFTVGGGLVVAPALTKFFGIKRQTTAQGLSLATVTPGAVVALLTYASHGRVNWQMGIPLALGGMISIAWGVDLAHKLPERMLRMLFCALIFGTALTLF
jgi:uncharacterized membrane protein YfcA